MCPPAFSSYFTLDFHQKSTKHGLKWKLASLSTSRAFEHHPKLHSFVVRCRRSSLLWLRKFSNFRYYNFWKFVIFCPTWTICISNESWKHSTFKFDIKNRTCYKKICVKSVFQNFRPIFHRIFFFLKLEFFKKIIIQPPIFMIATCFYDDKRNFRDLGF